MIPICDFYSVIGRQQIINASKQWGANNYEITGTF